jgi:hypothetical protein
MSVSNSFTTGCADKTSARKADEVCRHLEFASLRRSAHANAQS